MKIFLDTADVSFIQPAYETGLIDGVNTNPSLILKSGRQLLEVIDELSKFQNLQSISAEVVAETAEEMLSEAKKFYSDRKSTRLNSSHVSESRMPSSA